MKLDSWSWIGTSISLLYNARTENAGGTGAASDDAQVKRLRDLQDGVQRLQALPGLKDSAKQVQMNRIGLLKQRLDALKAMLRYASPEQVKAIAQEVRAIARELASVAKSLGTDSGGAAPGTAAVGATPNSARSTGGAESQAQGTKADATTAEADTATANAQATGDAGDAAEAGNATGKADDAQASTAKPAEGDSAAGRPAQGGDDAGLRTLLRDAEKILKEVIGLLKARIAMAGKEARQDLNAAEKSLAELDSVLAQPGSADLYTDQGSLSGASAATDTSVASALSGLNVNLTA